MKGKRFRNCRIWALIMALCLMVSTVTGTSVFAAEQVKSTESIVNTITSEDVSNWTVTPGADTTEANITFYLPAEKTGDYEIVVSRFSSAATIWQRAVVTKTDMGTGYFSCKASVKGMTPGEKYIYLVGDKGIGMAFTGALYLYTAPAAGSFTFAAVGDPQLYTNNLESNIAAWSDTVSKIASTGAGFIAGVGDQVDNGASEAEYNGFFKGLNSVVNSYGQLVLPFSPAIGNHDTKARDLYNAHYNIPNLQTSSLGISNYYYLHNNVLFVVLDTGNYPASGTGAANEADIEAAKPYISEYRATIEAAKSANTGKYNWLIVQHHKSTQSNANHWNDKDINAYIGAGFEDLMTSEKVDIVLAGHDHEYTRTYPFKSVSGEISIDKSNGNDGNALSNPSGTVYLTLNSASGSKFYSEQTELKETSKISVQNKKPMFTKIQVTDEVLTFNTYETDNMSSSVDSFTLTKNPEIQEVSDFVMTPGENETQLNVSWYSDSTLKGTPVVKIALADDAKNYTTFTGTQNAASEGYNQNKVTVTGLDANTKYILKVSADNGVTGYSTNYRFQTALPTDFTFAAVGDPQLYEKSLEANILSWSDTVNKIAAKGISFIAGTGDQVNDGKSAQEYKGFFTGLNSADRQLPFAPAVGNHDSSSREIYNTHYNMPNVQPSENGINNYYYMYNHVLFVVLDTGAYPASGSGEPSAEEIEAAKAYVKEYDAVLKTATESNQGNYRWLVVQHHKSTQSNASHWNDKDINAYIEAGLQDIMTKYAVDVVLAGHDHEYSRTYPIASTDAKVTLDKANGNDGNQLTDPQGTVYMTLNSASGSKFYGTHSPIKETAKVSMQNNVPMYTTVDITADTLTVKTYQTDNDQVADEFSITKTTPFGLPEHLTMAPGSNESELNFNWYSYDYQTGIPTVKIAPKSNPEKSKIFTGTQKASGKGYCQNQVTVTGLKADTEYIYNVSYNGKTFSQDCVYKTAEKDGFTFAAVGDPQVYDGTWDANNSETITTLEGWSKTIEAIAKGGASLIAGTGDQVDTFNPSYKEEEYGVFFAPEELRSLPYAAVMGNHEVNEGFQYHYNLPNEQMFDVIDDTYGQLGVSGNYFYKYNNVLFVVLNDAPYCVYPNGEVNAEAAKPYIEKYEETLKAAVGTYPEYDWLVVQHHKSTQSVGEHAHDADIMSLVEAGFEDLMTEYGVNLVLGGHDHGFARSYPFVSEKGTVTVDEDNMGDKIENTDGTVYMTLNSASGGKYYAESEDNYRITTNKAHQNFAPEYTMIDVTPDSLKIQTYDAQNGEKVDDFEILKKEKEDPSVQNPSSDKNQDKTFEKTPGKTPVTGDSTVWFIILGALLLSGECVRVVVLRKRRNFQ